MYVTIQFHIHLELSLKKPLESGPSMLYIRMLDSVVCSALEHTGIAGKDPFKDWSQRNEAQHSVSWSFSCHSWNSQ